MEFDSSEDRWTLPDRDVRIPPPVPAVDLATRVVRNTPLAPSYFSLWMRAPEVAHSVQPGQFVMIGIEAGLRPYLRRAFSVAQVLGDDIEILAKTVGPGTAALAEASVGTRVTVLGPLGRGFDLDRIGSGETVVLVAGGIGVAPFLITTRELARRKITTRIFFGGRTQADLVGADLLAEIAGARNVVLSTDDGSRGVHGRVTATLASELDRGLVAARLFACGPEPMFRALEPIVRERGIRSEFAMEREMACGFGVCLGCVVPTTEGHFATLCKEGPVVDPSTIDWERCPR